MARFLRREFECPHCHFKANIERSRIGNALYKFTCLRCSTTWEEKLVRAKPKPPASPPRPTSPSYEHDVSESIDLPGLATTGVRTSDNADADAARANDVWKNEGGA